MDRDQRVDGGDLEHTQDSRVGGGDAQAPTGVGQGARRSQQHPHTCRVEERALRQVDDNRIRDEFRKRLRQPRRGREVEVPRDVQNGGTGVRRLAAHVKIAGREHGRGV